MAFNIKIEGLKEFNDFISRNPSIQNAKVSANIAVDLLDIRQTLEERIEANYNIPYSLEKVFKGQNLKESESLLDIGISYEDKKIPLSEYPYTKHELDVRNAIPIKPEEGKKYYIPVNKAVQVISRVRKRGSIELPRFRPKYKKFLGTDAQDNIRIFSRKQKETWLKFPTEIDSEGIARGGKRADVEILFGPSLATLAERVYEKDKIVQQKIEKLTDKVIKSFQDFYE